MGAHLGYKKRKGKIIKRNLKLEIILSSEIFQKKEEGENTETN